MRPEKKTKQKNPQETNNNNNNNIYIIERHQLKYQHVLKIYFGHFDSMRVTRKTENVEREEHDKSCQLELNQ